MSRRGPADGALQDDPGHAEAAAVPIVARIFMVTNGAQLTALVTRHLPKAPVSRLSQESRPPGRVLADVFTIMVRGANNGYPGKVKTAVSTHNRLVCAHECTPAKPREFAPMRRSGLGGRRLGLTLSNRPPDIAGTCIAA